MTANDHSGVDRGNATVVGVALLIGITVASMGVITAGMGVVIEDHARTIEADRVTAALTTAIEETAAPGHRRRRLPVSAGRVETVERTVRVERDGTWTNWEANGIRYVSESGTRRVETVAGAVIRGEGASAVVTRDPSILASDETVAFTLPVLTGETHMAVSGTGVGGDAGSASQVGSGTGSGIRAGSGPGSGLTLETTVRHDRRDLGVGTFRVAIETTAPAALARSFERVAATAGVEATVERTTFPGDTHPSVVLTIEDERARHLLVREVTVEVRRG